MDIVRLVLVIRPACTHRSGYRRRSTGWACDLPATYLRLIPDLIPNRLARNRADPVEVYG
jgi:hypothetical protein